MNGDIWAEEQTRFIFTLKKTDKMRLAKLAIKKHRNMSDLMREALDHYLDQEYPS